MAQVNFTVLGGNGFIGRHLVGHLKSLGHDVTVPGRDMVADPDRDLGHVIYAIGLTGDFRSRPFDTIDAHVNRLSAILQGARFQSLLYLSSTRVYGGLGPKGVGREASPLPVTPSADSLYDLSKLLGEALCLGQANRQIRVARLSNVYGADQSPQTFLGAVMGELLSAGSVSINEDPKSSKDYISVENVAEILVQISQGGQERLYNVASGRLNSHQEIAETLRACTGRPVGFAENAPCRVFPQVDTSRICNEFGFQAGSVLDDLPKMLKQLSKQEAQP